MLRRHRAPEWALPAARGLVLVAIVAATSAAVSSAARAQDTFQIVAHQGTPVPGAPAGVQFTSDALGGLGFDRDGRYAFNFGVAGGEGVFLRRADGLVMVAGPDIAGLPRLVDWSPSIRRSDGSKFFFDDDGTITLAANGPTGESSLYVIDTGVVSGMPPSVSSLAVVGEAAPGGGTFTDVRTDFRARRNGLRAFRATVGGVESIYLYEDDALRRVVAVGDTVAGRTLVTLGDFDVDERGYVYFGGVSDAGSEPLPGIYRYTGTSFELVVLGDPDYTTVGDLASWSSWRLLPTQGLVLIAERIARDSGGGDLSERVVRRIGDSVTDVLVGGTDVGDGATFVDAFAIHPTSADEFVIQASLDTGGASYADGLLTLEDFGPAVLVKAGDVPPSGDPYAAFSRAAAGLTPYLVEAYHESGNRSVGDIAVGMRTLAAGDSVFADASDSSTAVTIRDVFLGDSIAVPLARIANASGELCLFYRDDVATGIACQPMEVAAGGVRLTMETGLGLTDGSHTEHVAVTTDLGVDPVGGDPSATIPTWLVEVTYNHPLTSVSLLVDGEEAPGVCDLARDAEGNTIGFTCSQADSVTLPLVYGTPVRIVANVDIGAAGLPDGVLQANWRVNGEDEEGTLLTEFFDTKMLTSVSVVDVGVRLSGGDPADEETTRAREVTFERFGGDADSPVAVVLAADVANGPFGPCTLSEATTSRTIGGMARDLHTCETTLSDALTATVDPATTFVAIWPIDGSFPVDTNADNDTLTLAGLYVVIRGPSEACAVAPPSQRGTAPLSLVALVAVGFFSARRRWR